jgi:hypothetical protein
MRPAGGVSPPVADHSPRELLWSRQESATQEVRADEVQAEPHSEKVSGRERATDVPEEATHRRLLKQTPNRWTEMPQVGQGQPELAVASSKP